MVTAQMLELRCPQCYRRQFDYAPETSGLIDVKCIKTECGYRGVVWFNGDGGYQWR